MSIKKVFIILVSDIGEHWKVSGLGFNNVNDAIKWIRQRSDKPQRYDSRWYWVGDNHEYKIVDVDVR